MAPFTAAGAFTSVILPPTFTSVAFAAGLGAALGAAPSVAAFTTGFGAGAGAVAASWIGSRRVVNKNVARGWPIIIPVVSCANWTPLTTTATVPSRARLNLSEVQSLASTNLR